MKTDLYGRSESDWDDLERAGLEILKRVARAQLTTTYSELNAKLRDRGCRAFDLDLQSERRAIGNLLRRVTDNERGESGHMISALVIYFDGNGPGPGFFDLAVEYKKLQSHATAERKQEFWLAEVKAIYQHYARRRQIPTSSDSA